MIMKISYLHLLIPLLCLSPYSAAGQQEGEGGDNCNAADGDTCTTTDADNENANGALCFPDGECFDTLNEAEIKYKPPAGRSTTIEMEVPKSFGDAQEVGSANPLYLTKTLEVLAKTHDYMVGLFQNDTAKSYRDECKVRHTLCSFWAAVGECEVVSLEI